MTFFFHFIKGKISKENDINNKYILVRLMYIYDCQNFKITDTDCGMSMWPEISLWDEQSFPSTTHQRIFFGICETTSTSVGTYLYGNAAVKPLIMAAGFPRIKQLL